VRRLPRSTGQYEHRRDRPMSLVIGLALGALATLVLVIAFTSRASLKVESGQSRPRPVSVSRGAKDFPLNCLVRVLTPVVRLGERVETTFSYTNTGLTSYRLPIDGGSPRLLVYDSQGALVYDTDSAPYYVAGIDSDSDLVLPGESLDRVSGFQANWPGLLTLRPMCGYGVPDDSRVFVERGVVEPPSLIVEVLG
jgi:hypothetical protein